MAAVNAAVVRVKRHFDEEPLDALVLACKRRKHESDSTSEQDNPFTTILKFAGTVKNQHENVAMHISSFRKDVKALTHVVDLGAKLRTESKKCTQDSRYKVVNGFRALDNLESVDSSEETTHSLSHTETTVEDVNNKYVMIMDIEDSKPKEDHTETVDSYVYDLYYTGDGTDNLDDALLDQMVSVRPLPCDLVYRDADSEPEYAEDDKDSNDENNSGNEYPDTDTDDSMDDEMKLAMELGEFHIGEELSSDEADEGYLRYEDVDPIDVARYGQGYARYKARVTQELYCHSDKSDSDSD